MRYVWRAERRDLQGQSLSTAFSIFKIPTLTMLIISLLRPFLTCQIVRKSFENHHKYKYVFRSVVKIM